MMNTGKRIAYIDLAKGICIMLVVFFHTKGILFREYWFDPFLSSFRLPLYFLLSGLFFRDYGSFRRFLTKKVNRLLVPFLFFYLLSAVLLPNVMHQVWGVNFGTITGIRSLWAFLWPGEYPNIPIWFLWCLFLMNLLFWFFEWANRYCSRRWNSFSGVCLLVFLSLLCGYFGYTLKCAYSVDVGNILKALSAMPFFCFGYLVGRNDGLTFLANLSKLKALALFVLLFGICFSFSQFVTSDDVSLSFLLQFVEGATGAMMIVVASRMMVRIPFVSYIGRYSIIVLLTHGILVRCLSPFCLRLSSFLDADLIIFVATLLILLSYLLIIPLSCRYLPYFVAQKPLFPEK